jgi:hypothetical protein
MAMTGGKDEIERDVADGSPPIAYRDATAGGELRAASFKGLQEAE